MKLGWSDKNRNLVHLVSLFINCKIEKKVMANILEKCLLHTFLLCVVV